MTNYTASKRQGSNAGERYWEGEGIAGRGMIGGAGRSVRERGKGVGLVWGRAGPAGSRVRPRWAAGSLLLYFFFLFSFSFDSDFYFENLKRLLYSDLNKSHADHFCSIKVCLKLKNQRFSYKMEEKIICRNFKYRVQYRNLLEGKIKIAPLPMELIKNIFFLKTFCF
jgi:hypothetical protein